MNLWTILWGTLLIAIGTTMMLNTLGIVKNVPIFELSVALILIIIGIKQIIVDKKDKVCH